MEHFTAAQAAEKSHAEIAKIARALVPDHVENPDWWAQGIAIAFEHHVGLRVPGQSATGTFRVSASRTLPGGRDDVLDLWITANAGREHQGYPLTNERTSRTEKRSFWRATAQGAGKLDVAAAPKGDDKTILSVEHIDLSDEADIEVWRAYWKEQLAALTV